MGFQDLKIVCVIFVLSAFVGQLAVAAEITGTKDDYHLFNPTPKNLMRGLNTDRPDKTESPYSVDAGHFQFETDIVTNTVSKQGGVTTRTYGININNLKLGLTNNTDLQLVIANYVVQKTNDNGNKSSERGIGETLVRYKVNLMGNDGGPVAFGVMPFVKLPTNKKELGNQNVEGGLIFPAAIELPKDWSLGLMYQANYDRNSSDDGYHISNIMTITAGHSIVGDLSGYTELYTESSGDQNDKQNIVTFDTGLTYALEENWQLDGGVNWGITQDADDFQPFLGLSALF